MSTISCITPHPRRERALGALALTLAFTLAFCGCNRAPEPGGQARADASRPGGGSAAEATNLDPCAMVLAGHLGDGPLDRQIIRWQEAVRSGVNQAQALDRLGWAYVAQGRASLDHGFYTLAEQCARCLEGQAPGSLEAMLLRGHVLHSLHRFSEAEPLARELVRQRGAPFDYGLLGDVLLDLGRLEEATSAYQQMMDLRPDLQSYARAAQVRWLTGDLEGALEAARAAAGMASRQDPESAAWIHTRLAFYEFQSSSTAEAEEACATALGFQEDYPPALVMRGRLRLSEGNHEDAIAALRRAIELNPLPEAQWLLADGLREAGRAAEAEEVEEALRERGPRLDPRTVALFLATRGESSERAVALAEAELSARADLYTHDALAWALAGVGRISEAQTHVELALAAGTADARLHLHAAIIAARAGRESEAAQHVKVAAEHAQQLLPSEVKRLGEFMAPLASTDTDSSAAED